MTYRFVGTKMNIGDIELVKVGQPIQLDTVDWRWPLVTEKQFEAAAFDAAELEKYGHHAARHMAPPEFMAAYPQMATRTTTPARRDHFLKDDGVSSMLRGA